MSNVVKISDARPHLSGPAWCIECGHKWEIVAPIGLTVIECPKCGGHKGARFAMVQKEGPHWECNCGNGLFFIRDAGTYCPNCGADGPLVVLP